MLDDIVQILGSDGSDLCRRAKAFEDFVDLIDPCAIGSTFIDHDGFVAQIPFRDSSHESSMIAGGYEQLGPYEAQDHELVDLQ